MGSAPGHGWHRSLPVLMFSTESCDILHALQLPCHSLYFLVLCACAGMGPTWRLLCAPAWCSCCAELSSWPGQTVKQQQPLLMTARWAQLGRPRLRVHQLTACCHAVCQSAAMVAMVGVGSHGVMPICLRVGVGAEDSKQVPAALRTDTSWNGCLSPKAWFRGVHMQDLCLLACL